MRGRRTLTLLVVFLVALPIVTATADGVQKVAEDELVVRSAPLHEGERYVYDLHLRSLHRDLDLTVPAFQTLDIERIRDHEALDGSVHDVIATTITAKPEPWGDATRTIEHEVTTQYIRVSDGVYVERSLETRETSWSEGPDGLERRDRERESRRAGSSNGGDLYARGVHPASPFANGNLVQNLLLELVGVTHQWVADKGTWNGRTVYDVDGRQWESTSARTQFRCDSTLPDVDYTDFGSRSEFATRTLTERTTLRTWIDPTLALPVLNDCHATYHDGDALVEELRLQVELAEHTPGGEAIPVRWDRMNERDSLASAPVLEPAPTHTPGTPTGALPRGASLDAMLDHVRATTDPRVAAWHDAHGEFWLVQANYDKRHEWTAASEEEDDGPLPVPVPLAPDPTQPQEQELVATGIVWHLTLEGFDGARLEVQLAQNHTEGGLGDPRIEAVETLESVPPVVRSRIPDALVPLDRHFARYLEETDMDAAAWDADPRASVVIENGIIDDGHRGHRVSHTIRISHSDPERDVDPSRGAATLSRQYDARNGAIQEASWRRYEDRGASAPPPEPDYAPASDVAATPVSRFPTAATASGVALALGFVAVVFSDTLGRAFGQFIGAPLYAKIHRNKVLDHRTRDRIVDCVTENPGIAVEEIRRTLSVGYGTVCHHLDTLQRNGLLTSRKVGRRRCYFVPGSVDADQMDAVAAGTSAAASRVLDLVRENPGLSQSEIAKRLGIADGSVRYQAKRLLAHERLRAERDGRTVRYYPCDGAAAA